MTDQGFRATVRWQNAGATFEADSFSRDHTVTFGGGHVLGASSAPEYRGDGSRVNPEELLASAVASCHMLTFLVIAAKRRKHVLSYEDDAHAYLGTDAEGRMGVTEIRLHPRVRFAEGAPTAEELAKLHDLAHRNCFVARALRATVTLVPDDPSGAQPA